MGRGRRRGREKGREAYLELQWREREREREKERGFDHDGRRGYYGAFGGQRVVLLVESLSSTNRALKLQTWPGEVRKREGE